MTEISFYVASKPSLEERLLVVCRLVHKANKKRMHVHVHTDSAETSKRLDELLWSFQATSFIPHAMAEHADGERVIIAHVFEPENDCDLLINVSDNIPDFFARFKRIGEVIDQTPEILAAGRERYAYYRKRGYTLKYHQL